MCCAAQSLSPVPPRRATVRVDYLCRGRGGRGCRCHITARPTLAQPHPPRKLHLPPMIAPHHAPQRPQGPPCPI